jgi:hypothetical protein
MPKGMLMLTLILIAGFKTCNGTKPNSLTKSSTTMNKPATSNTELSSHEGTATDQWPTGVPLPIATAGNVIETHEPSARR